MKGKEEISDELNSIRWVFTDEQESSDIEVVKHLLRERERILDMLQKYCEIERWKLISSSLAFLDAIETCLKRGARKRK